MYNSAFMRTFINIISSNNVLFCNSLWKSGPWTPDRPAVIPKSSVDARLPHRPPHSLPPLPMVPVSHIPPILMHTRTPQPCRRLPPALTPTLPRSMAFLGTTPRSATGRPEDAAAAHTPEDMTTGHATAAVARACGATAGEGAAAAPRPRQHAASPRPAPATAGAAASPTAPPMSQGGRAPASP